MARPHSPAHLNVHNPTLSDERPESFTFTIQDAHHATTHLQACLTYSPLLISRSESLEG